MYIEKGKNVKSSSIENTTNVCATHATYDFFYGLFGQCLPYTLSSTTGSGQVKYMATPFFDFYMTTGYVL